MASHTIPYLIGVCTIVEEVNMLAMDPCARPPSSVYSNQFQLDDLVDEISKWTLDCQQEQLLQALSEQQQTLQMGLEAARDRWAEIHQVMLQAAETAFVLRKLVGDARGGARNEEQNWMVNCTAPI